MLKRYSSSCGEIQYEERQFESDCFKNKTFEIFELESDSDLSRGLIEGFISDQNLSKGDLIYARFPSNDIKHIQAANSAGFYYVETSIEPYILTNKWDRNKFINTITETHKARVEDREELMKIAHGMFKELRFNLDRAIGNELANYRYVKWLSNLYENDQDIQIIKVQGKIMGFMVISYKDEQAIWILGGVREGYQGKGVGLILYSSVLDYCVNKKNIKTIRTGISISNIPVLNIYSKLGFKFKNPTVVLHYNV